MEKINVFDVQIPDGRQIRCISYNKVTYFDLDDICKLCNMSLGFKVGEDEHAAYIAGFAGDCVSEFINSKNTD